MLTRRVALVFRHRAHLYCIQRHFSSQPLPSGSKPSWISSSSMANLGTFAGVRENITMFQRMWPFVWPRKGDQARAAKTRIGLAFGMLLAGKLLNVQVPYLFKEIVERINEALGTEVVSLDVFAVAGTVLLGCTRRTPRPSCLFRRYGCPIGINPF